MGRDWYSMNGKKASRRGNRAAIILDHDYGATTSHRQKVADLNMLRGQLKSLSPETPQYTIDLMNRALEKILFFPIDKGEQFGKRRGWSYSHEPQVRRDRAKPSHRKYHIDGRSRY